MPGKASFHCLNYTISAFLFQQKALAAQEADGEVPDVNPPKNEKNADLNAVMAAFDRETGAEKWEK